jgi:hypothetical protein
MYGMLHACPYMQSCMHCYITYAQAKDLGVSTKFSYGSLIQQVPHWPPHRHINHRMILIARLFVGVVSGFPLRVWLSMLTYGDVGVGRVAAHGVGHHACMAYAYHVDLR